MIVKKWRTGFIFDVVSKRFICRKKAAEEIQREGAAHTIRTKDFGTREREVVSALCQQVYLASKNIAKDYVLSRGYCVGECKLNREI